MMAVFLSGAVSEASQTGVIENAFLRIEIGGGPAPAIQRMVHRASGREIVSGSKGISLFSISLKKPDGVTETIDSSTATQSSVEVSGSVASVRFSGLRVPGISADITVTSETNGPLTFWTMRVQNNSGHRITAVRFPQILAVPTIAEGRDDVLVLPAMSGALIQDPAANWRDGQSVTMRYPGDLSAQFIAYQDESAGLYLAGMDASAHPKNIAVLKQAGGFRLWHEIAVAADAKADGGSWQSPYPVAIGATAGTWCNTADQYKRWAIRQPWCAKTVNERKDIPDWWKSGPDVHVCEVRTYDDKRTCNGSYYPRLLDHLRTFRQKIDGPIVAMLAGWENHRRWTAGDYFPIFDSDNAKRAIAAMREEGFRPFFFLSGLYYTHRNEGRDGGEIPSAAQHVGSYVIDEKTTGPKEYTLNESNPSGDWKRHSYQFCVGAPSTKKFFEGVVDQTHATGVDVLQMDQTTHGAGDACYSKSHGHAPGPGLYQTISFCELLDAMRERGKKASPDFILLHEEPHERLIPHLDGFHVREYFEKRWYRGHPGAIGIPLFSYLYHEYAIGYGGDSAGFSKDNNRWHVRCHAMNLVAGRTPGGSIWSSHQSMYDAHPDQIAVVRNHCRLLKTRAKDFLMLGKMLHPMQLSVPAVDVGLGVRRGDKWVTEKLPTPVILTSSWQAPDGNIGHLFVNIAETKQSLKAALDTRNAPLTKPCDAQIFRTSSGRAFEPLWQNAQMPRELMVEIEPTEAIFVELRPHLK